MTRREFKSYLHEICRRCGDDLEENGMALYDKMTDDERLTVTQNDAWPYRLAKGILCAIVANGLIDRQWNAEALKTDVKRLRKIDRSYR